MMYVPTPEKGTIVEVQPERVSKEGKLCGRIVDKGNCQCIINKSGFDILFSESMKESILTPPAWPFTIDSSETASAEVIGDAEGVSRVKVKLVDKGQEQKRRIFKSNDREEPIEWDGTPQDADQASSDNRKEVFKEDDPRGSKNDLI